MSVAKMGNFGNTKYWWEWKMGSSHALRLEFKLLELFWTASGEICQDLKYIISLDLIIPFGNLYYGIKAQVLKDIWIRMLI